MDKTYYILYQVTNNLNSKIYVGVHKTKNLDDGYMGSGKVINAAIAKYGIENFTRVILEQFENSAAMYAREKEVVTDEFLLREDTYNLRRGGSGGFDYINKLPYINDVRRANGNRITIEQHKLNAQSTNNKGTMQKTHRAGKLVHTYFGNRTDDYLQRASSAEAIAKKKETWKKNKTGQGEKNSQFGTKWITNNVSNKKIKKDALVPEGWRAGRYIP